MKHEATVGLGVAFRGQRRYEDAMTQYKRALELDSSNSDVLYNMGILLQDYLFDGAKPQNAIAQLEQAKPWRVRH